MFNVPSNYSIIFKGCPTVLSVNAPPPSVYLLLIPIRFRAQHDVKHRVNISSEFANLIIIFVYKTD